MTHLTFEDTKTPIKIGELGFGILANEVMIYGVVRDIKDTGAAFGYAADVNWAYKVYKYYPLYRCHATRVQLTIEF